MMSVKAWVVAAAVGVVAIVAIDHANHDSGSKDPVVSATSSGALTDLDKLRVANVNATTAYSRAAFGKAWADVDHNGCDTRDDILARDITTGRQTAKNRCTVESGVFVDPYTGKVLEFRRGPGDKVQIDHVVPLGNAWLSGADVWTTTKREQFANDPRNLLAVDSHNNEAKGDKDAANWLPPDKSDDCRYVGIQIDVKTTYHLTVTTTEKKAMQHVLSGCAGG